MNSVLTIVVDSVFECVIVVVCGCKGRILFWNGQGVVHKWVKVCIVDVSTL